MITPPENLIVRIGCNNPHQFHNLGLWSAGLLKLMGMAENDSLLDLGCGCGRLPIAMDWHKGKYLGIDIDHDAIMWCKNNLEREFIEAPAHNLSFLTEPYDYIVAHSLLTHLPKETMISTLREIKRLLTKKAFVTFLCSKDHTYNKGSAYYYPRVWLNELLDKEEFKFINLEGSHYSGYGFWSHDIYILEAK